MPSKVNGYLLYMQDMKRQVSHWSKKGIPEMMTLASPGWNSLSQREKDDYNNRAKEMRGVETARSTGGGGGGGMDAHGRSLQFIQERDREEKLEFDKKMSVLDNLVQDKNGNLADKMFYVMHASVFSKFTALSEKDEAITWIPAEIAVSKFSLSSGLIATYQAFPLPGKLPVGSKWECRQKEEKLQIPLTPEDSSFNKKDLELLEDLRAFLGSSKTCFVMPELEDEVRGVLDQITKRSEQPSLGLTYLSLPRLMFKLRIASCKTEEEVMANFPFENIALAELEKEKFLYSGGLACDHHEQRDTSKCCQTLVASWVFTLLDLCCPGYNIELVPGSHAPHKVSPIKPVLWKAENNRRSSGGMSISVTEEGVFASQDVRYKKESSTSSVTSGSSYQRYVGSVEDKDIETQDGASTVESSDQEDTEKTSVQEDVEKSSVQDMKESSGSIERPLSVLSIRSSVLTDSRSSAVSDLSSLRRSIGRGTLLERLKRSSTVRPGSVA